MLIISTSLVDHANSKVPSALASPTKGGLSAVTKSLAIEYAARGICVNAIALVPSRHPCIPRPPMTRSPPCIRSGRMGEIEDVVGGDLYLEKAPFVTGEILHVDGGQSAGG